MESNKNRRGPAIKAAVLIIFLVAAIVIARFTPLREYLTAEKLRLLLETAGPWAPVAYIGAYAAGVCFFMPGTLLATVGAAIFGPYYGFSLRLGGSHDWRGPGVFYRTLLREGFCRIPHRQQAQEIR